MTPGVVHVFVKSYLVLTFANVWPVLIYLKKIRIMKCCSIMILTPQRINDICKDELARSEDNKSHFISFSNVVFQDNNPLNIITERKLNLFALFFYI